MNNIDCSVYKDLALILLPSMVALVTLYFIFTQKRKDGQSEIDNKRNQLSHIYLPLEKFFKHDYKAGKVKKAERKGN